MKIKEFQAIFNVRYNPKQALGYFVESSKELKNTINIEDTLILLEEKLLDNNKNINILENLSINSLDKITNYWSLSLEQVIDYGYIIFNEILKFSKDFTEDIITDTFITVMQLYSPDNAVTFVNKRIGK